MRRCWVLMVALVMVMGVMAQGDTLKRYNVITEPLRVWGLSFGSSRAVVKAEVVKRKGVVKGETEEGIGFLTAAPHRFAGYQMQRGALLFVKDKLSTGMVWLKPMVFRSGGYELSVFEDYADLKGRLTKRYGEPTFVDELSEERIAGGVAGALIKERGFKHNAQWVLMCGDRKYVVCLDVVSDGLLSLVYWDDELNKMFLRKRDRDL